MASSKLIRWSGLLALVGGFLVITVWILVAFTAGGTRDVFGLSEPGWRTLLLNPALVFFMAGFAGFYAKQAGRLDNVGKTGFVVCLMGLGTMLLGNIIEFWVSEPLYGTQLPGWAIMGVGLSFLPIGLLLFGLGTLRAGFYSGWRRVVPLCFGVILTSLILIGVASVLLSGSQSQVGVFRAVVSAFAAGWATMGSALWFERKEPGTG